MSRTLTAAGFGLFSCRSCGLVSRKGEGSEENRCPRCAAPVHFRKPHSTTRTWAFLTAAYLLYLPANLLPILETTSLHGSRKDTIMSGIIALWRDGSWEIALIVFIASITVPLLKLVALTLLLIAVRFRTPPWPEQLTRLYRMLILIGRWSMLDIYVTVTLAALVRFRLLSVMSVGPAALPFGAVVVLTMLAASEFDPRLIWDACGEREKEI